MILNGLIKKNKKHEKGFLMKLKKNNYEKRRNKKDT